LAGGIKDRLREKFDPRQLINQRGLMTTLFPGLKTYQSKTSGAPRVAGKSIEQSSLDVSDIKPIFENIQNDSKLTAKNLSVLPSIHRDFNVIRQNVVKLLKLEKIDAATRADMFFKAAAKREEMYESQLSKIKEEKKSPEKIKSGISGGSVLDFLVFGGILTLTILSIEKVGEAIDKIKNIDLKEALDDFTNFLSISVEKIFSSLDLSGEPSDSEIKQALSKITFSELTDEQKTKLIEKQGGLEGAEAPNMVKELNNPGAMIFADWQKKYGGEPGKTVKGPDGKTRTFTKFPSMEKGKEAQRALWESDAYKNKPLSEALGKWVDPNNKEAFDNYMKGIASAIGIKKGQTSQTQDQKQTTTNSSSRMPIEQGLLESFYGMRTMKNQKTGQMVTRMHEGVDITMPEGTDKDNVFASDTGKVTYSGMMGGYGQTIKIQHDDGTSSLYAHLKELSVKVGDRVNRGQPIAKSGGARGAWYSGGSTGPHLHFELRDKNGKLLDPLEEIPELRGSRTKRKVTKGIISPVSMNNFGGMIDSNSSVLSMQDLYAGAPIVYINNNTNRQNIIISNNNNTNTKDYLPKLLESVIA
jgi:murein DD-endopeptidase MepM/ murein hydrolase activator NlpD